MRPEISRLCGLLLIFSLNGALCVVVINVAGDVPVYATLGVQKNISCTATSSSADDRISNLKLTNGTSGQFEVVAWLGDTISTNRAWAGGMVNASCPSFKPPGSVTCTFVMTSIVDGTYMCSVVSLPAASDQQFSVITTRMPDAIYTFSSSSGQNVSAIELNEGDSANLTCAIVNSKPVYQLTWSTTLGGNNGPVTVTSGNLLGSVSQWYSFTARQSDDGARITCTGSPGIPSLSQVTTAVDVVVYYGPANLSESVTLRASGGAAVTCALNSKPKIVSYAWTQDDKPMPLCTTSTCVPNPDQTKKSSTLQCTGVNEKTQLIATHTIFVTWSFAQPGAATTTSNDPSPGASQDPSDSPSPGAIAGIVIGSIAGLALIIIIPVVVYMKRKGSKNAGGPRASAGGSGLQPRPYSFDNTSSLQGSTQGGVGYKSPVSPQPDVVRHSGSHLPSQGGQQKAPPTPPPAYPEAMDQIDDKPRSRKPIAIYDNMPEDGGYPSQLNASYMSSPKY